MSLSDGELKAVRGIAESLFPQAVAAASARVWSAWRRSLEVFEMAVIASALERLAREDPAFPSLAELISECREIQPGAALKALPGKAPAPGRPPGPPPRQGLEWFQGRWVWDRDYDQSAGAWLPKPKEPVPADIASADSGLLL